MKKNLESQLSEIAEGEFVSVYEHKSEISIYTAVKTYKNKGKNFEVKLAGEIHYGEKSYFESIEKELKTLDKILYEEIKQTELSWKDRLSPAYLSLLASNLESLIFEKMIKLKFSEYSKGKNWEHCDITIKEYIDDIKKQNLSSECIKAIPLTLLFGIYNLITPPEELKKDFIISLIEQDIIEGDELNPTELFFRNKKVKTRLNEIYKNNSDYKVGILYGAAHMLDFESHITKKLGCEKIQEKWLKTFSTKK